MTAPFAMWSMVATTWSEAMSTRDIATCPSTSERELMASHVGEVDDPQGASVPVRRGVDGIRRAGDPAAGPRARARVDLVEDQPVSLVSRNDSQARHQHAQSCRRRGCCRRSWNRPAASGSRPRRRTAPSSVAGVPYTSRVLPPSQYGQDLAGRSTRRRAVGEIEDGPVVESTAAARDREVGPGGVVAGQRRGCPGATGGRPGPSRRAASGSSRLAEKTDQLRFPGRPPDHRPCRAEGRDRRDVSRPVARSALLDLARCSAAVEPADPLGHGEARTRTRVRVVAQVRRARAVGPVSRSKASSASAPAATAGRHR